MIVRMIIRMMVYLTNITKFISWKNAIFILNFGWKNANFAIILGLEKCKL